MDKKLVEGLEDFLNQDLKLVKCTCAFSSYCPIHGHISQPEYGVPPIRIEQ